MSRLWTQGRSLIKPKRRGTYIMLISCPECGRKISDQSIFCVGCGLPSAAYNLISEVKIDKSTEIQEDIKVENENNNYTEEIVENNVTSIVETNKRRERKTKKKDREIKVTVEYGSMRLVDCMKNVINAKSYQLLNNISDFD